MTWNWPGSSSMSGGGCVLEAIDLVVPPGAWRLLVGRNGAGKSLLTRLILGLDASAAGRIRVLGQDPQGLPAPAMVELARALIHRPDLLVWDGFTDGPDPAAVRVERREHLSV